MASKIETLKGLVDKKVNIKKHAFGYEIEPFVSDEYPNGFVRDVSTDAITIDHYKYGSYIFKRLYAIDIIVVIKL